jgi:phage terminase large subunit-like protein
VTLDGPLEPEHGRSYVVAVDLGIKRDRTAAAVCHLEPVEQRWEGVDRHEQGQRVVLDRLQVWQGSSLRPVKLDAVEEWVAQAVGSFNRAEVVVDPWQAVGLAQRLRDKGVRVSEFTFSSASVGRLASTLHLLLRNRALALPDDSELIDELANVRLRETSPGVLRMDHDPGRHDDRAIALALAAQALLSTSQAPVRVSTYRHTGASRGGWSPSADRDHLLRKMAMRGDQRALGHLDRQRGSRARRRR